VAWRSALFLAARALGPTILSLASSLFLVNALYAHPAVAQATAGSSRDPWSVRQEVLLRLSHLPLAALVLFAVVGAPI